PQTTATTCEVLSETEWGACRDLTVKLRGRTQAPDQSRGCTLSSCTRGHAITPKMNHNARNTAKYQRVNHTMGLGIREANHPTCSLPRVGSNQTQRSSRPHEMVMSGPAINARRSTAAR